MIFYGNPVLRINHTVPRAHGGGGGGGGGGGTLIFYIYIGLADFFGVKILKFGIFWGVFRKITILGGSEFFLRVLFWGLLIN